jgi:hypothetical protein
MIRPTHFNLHLKRALGPRNGHGIAEKRLTSVYKDLRRFALLAASGPLVTDALSGKSEAVP